jgi:predicted DNA-binding transcriptional regulator AlpA
MFADLSVFFWVSLSQAQCLSIVSPQVSQAHLTGLSRVEIYGAIVKILSTFCLTCTLLIFEIGRSISHRSRLISPHQFPRKSTFLGGRFSASFHFGS